MLKEVEILQQHHAEQHEHLLAALKKSSLLNQKFKALLPYKKAVTILSMPSSKSHKTDKTESKDSRVAKMPSRQSRVQSVEQLGFALIFGEHPQTTRKSLSAPSIESLQNMEPSAKTSSHHRPSPQASSAQPFDLMPGPVSGDVNEPIEIPIQIPGVLDEGAQPTYEMSSILLEFDLSLCRLFKSIRVALVTNSHCLQPSLINMFLD